QLDLDTCASEDPDESIDESTDAMAIGPERLAADERHEPAHPSLEIFERDSRASLRGPQVRTRDDATEIPVALGAGHEHRERPARAGRRPDRRTVMEPGGFSPRGATED